MSGRSNDSNKPAEEQSNPLSNSTPSNEPDAAAAAPAPRPVDVDGPNADVPIAADDDDDEDFEASSPGRRKHTSEIFASQGGVKYSWRHISYTVDMPDGSKRKLLNNISGTAQPGRVLAVVGPSGAGKTTLLNAIGGRLIIADNAELEGSTYLNDIVLTENHKPIVSFVCQDDIVMPKETPIDAFRFSAAMRNQNLASEEVERRAENMIKDLKLTTCRDTVMGIPGLIKGLSGGEKRRCNIGVELINNPPVIFLDEPTSGLDSVAAYRIGKLLRALAHVEGRTVICTVHSPSSELFALFDDLLLLGQGEVVYHGPAAGVKQYFASIGFPPPDRINPSEYAMYLLQSAPEELKEYVDCWNRCAEKVVPGYTRALPAAGNGEGDKKNSSNNNGTSVVPVGEDKKKNHQQQLENEKAEEEMITRRTSSFQEQDPAFVEQYGDRLRQNLALPPAVINKDNAVVSAMMKERKPATFFHQFVHLCGRSWRNQVRDPMLTFARVGQTIIFALFIGLVYVNLELSTAGVQDRQGLMFLFMIQTTFLSLMPGLMAFPPELSVFLQDQSNGLYNPGVFYWVKAIVELPLNTVIPTLFTIIIYFMAGLGGTAEQFFRFYCIALLTSYNARALGMLIGAFLGRSPESAFVVAPLCVMPQAFVAGLFANTDRLEPGWVWLEWISFCRYSYKAMFRIEFEGIGDICSPTNPSCRYPTGYDVIRYMGFDLYENDKFGYSVLWMCIIMLFFSLMGTVAMFYQSSKQRVELRFSKNHERIEKAVTAAAAAAADDDDDKLAAENKENDESAANVAPSAAAPAADKEEE